MPADPTAGTHGVPPKKKLPVPAAPGLSLSAPVSRPTPPQQPKRRPKQLPVPAAPGLGAAITPSPRPKFPHGQPELPHPTLQAAGYQGGVNSFNQKVEAIASAHQKAYGQLPSPGLVLDIARSDVHPNDYEHLFSVPKSPIVARNMGVLAKSGLTADTAPDNIGESLANDLANVHSRDELNDFLSPDNAGMVEKAMADPASRKAFETAYADAARRVGVAEKSPHPSLQVRAATALPVSGSFLSSALGEMALAGKQVSTGLVLGLPTLAVAEGKAIVKSVEKTTLKDVALNRVNIAPFEHTNAELGKAIVTGYKRDATHPGANPGNLMLDIFGLASFGVGAVARVSAAGAALRAGEAGLALRALATKPMTGTYHLGEGADMPLSGNPLVAEVQKAVLDRRTKGLSLDETNASPVPTSASATIGDLKAGEIADSISNPLRRNFSIENKIGRQIRANDRVERAVRLALVEPLERATGSAKSTSLVIRRLKPSGWKGLSVGEQKAIQVLTTDDPNPLATWRDFHKNMIEQGVGDPNAHRAHLAALKQAEKAIANPSPKFAKALQAVYHVMDEQTQLRIENMGMSPLTAQERVARLGATLRGEQTFETDVPGSIYAESSKTIGLLKSGKLKGEEAKVARARISNLNKLAENPTIENARSLGLATKSSNDVLDALGIEAKQKPAQLLAEGEKANPNATYLLFQSLAKKRRGGTTFFSSRPGPFGIPAPGSLPELSHYFTGDVIKSGNFRIDATRLATESYARTVALVMKLDSWKRLHDHYSTEAPRSADDIPIRDAHAVDDHLRELLAKVDSGQILSAEDVQGLPSQMTEDLTRHLMPHPEDAVSGDAKWRWVDPRYLASEPKSALPTPLVRAFSNVNEPLRDLTLFVRPAYLINAINSAEMIAIDQGLLAIPNFVRALKANDWYGPAATRALDAMAGEGRMMSYAPNVGGATRVSHTLARAWSHVTDLYFRRAAVIFHLRKLGYRTSEQITKVLEDSLHDEAAMKDVKEASQRAKKSMVEMDNLVPFEKNVLRHVVFVYPWVSRSAVWSLRTLAEHPMQAAIYNEIGQNADEELDPVLKHLPTWMKNTGYVPVGWNADGSPKMVNSGSVNTFATLGEIAGLAQTDSTFTDLLGPGAELAVRLAEERDRFGRKYKRPYVDPFLDVAGGLPQLSAVKRAGQKEPAEKPLDITNPNALVEQANADVHRPVFYPGGFWNTYGPLVLGGLDPRKVDARAVDARWWQGQPFEARKAHELELVQKWTTAQGQFIGRRVPATVREANKLASDMSVAYHSFSLEHGRAPTMYERTQLDIETLHGLGRINDKNAEKMLANLKSLAPDELPTFRSGVLSRYANGKDASEWHRQVALVSNITNRQNLDSDIQRLRSAGILPESFKDAANVGRETLHAYGLQYLAYDSKLRDFAAREKKARDAGNSTDAIADELRIYVDQQDRPLKVNGKVLPSLPRLAVARLTPEQLQAHVVDNYSRSFSSLTVMDKELMGVKSTPAITEAWVGLGNGIAAYRKQYPGARLSSQQLILAATRYDAEQGLGGKFLAEVKLSEAPRWQQYKQERIYTQSKFKADWDGIFSAAKQETAYLSSSQYDHTAARAMWKKAMEEQLIPDLKARYPEFWKELQPYLRSDPAFLDNLIKSGR